LTRDLLLCQLTDTPARQAGRVGDSSVRPPSLECFTDEAVALKAQLFRTLGGPLVAGLGLPEFFGGHRGRTLLFPPRLPTIWWAYLPSSRVIATSYLPQSRSSTEVTVAGFQTFGKSGMSKSWTRTSATHP
jgi:hypothetical protein